MCLFLFMVYQPSALFYFFFGFVGHGAAFVYRFLLSLPSLSSFFERWFVVGCFLLLLLPIWSTFLPLLLLLPRSFFYLSLSRGVSVVKIGIGVSFLLFWLWFLCVCLVVVSQKPLLPSFLALFSLPFFLLTHRMDSSPVLFFIFSVLFSSRSRCVTTYWSYSIVVSLSSFHFF